MAKKLSPGTKNVFAVGDKVTLINLGAMSGLNGKVMHVKGLINKKYVVKLVVNGKNTQPLKPRFLTRDKRN